ncbi:MAG: efflux RND transporter periplasmic adaptor subunit [Candidatus Hinthialibacter antarcticus]|nr:efflux RND transporter periplasmic adaptor subunit [Candidatus Hinthialibacter antarcticus]
MANITLTPEAEERLGIVTHPVEVKPVNRRQTYNGEILTPPGRLISVTAPFNGEIQPPPESEIPKPGSLVAKGQAVLAYLPLLTPERDVLTPSERVRLAEANASLASTRIEAQGQVESAKVKINAAKIELNRTEQLLEDKVGNARAVDDAKAKLRLAEEELSSAQARLSLLSRTNLDAEAGTLQSNVILSPDDGILQNLFVAVGQSVAAGAPLFEILNNETVWVRVPVYVGDVERIQSEAMAHVGNVSDFPGKSTTLAHSISAPPSANPDSVTINLFYEMVNLQSQFRTGQRVSVSLELKGNEENSTVPWSSVLYDIHGDAWVYEKLSEHTYQRSRIEVLFVKDEDAVIASGPKPGTQLVTDGAAELFGTEFGNSK